MRKQALPVLSNPDSADGASSSSSTHNRTKSTTKVAKAAGTESKVNVKISKLTKAKTSATTKPSAVRSKLAAKPPASPLQIDVPIAENPDLGLDPTNTNAVNTTADLPNARINVIGNHEELKKMFLKIPFEHRLESINEVFGGETKTNQKSCSHRGCGTRPNKCCIGCSKTLTSPVTYCAVHYPEHLVSLCFNEFVKWDEEKKNEQ